MGALRTEDIGGRAEGDLGGRSQGDLGGRAEGDLGGRAEGDLTMGMPSHQQMEKAPTAAVWHMGRQQ